MSVEREIEGLKSEWRAAFREMKKYFYNEIFDTFSITYDARTWHRFKNPALIYPMEREMRFSTPNERVRFDYYSSFLSKLGIVSHNFAYLADIEEFYSGDLHMFLHEQSQYVTTMQRANLRVAHFLPDALVEVTAQGLRSFIRLKLGAEAEAVEASSRGRGEERGAGGKGGSVLGEYEEPLVLMETLGLMGMPRRDDILSFFAELSEHAPDFVRVFLRTQNFSYAGLATPPWLNADKKFGIRRRADILRAGKIILRFLEGEIGREEAIHALKNMYFTTYLEDFNVEEVVDMRWINLEMAKERVERTLKEFERKASRRTSFHCYEDFSDALRRIYERVERTLAYFG